MMSSPFPIRVTQVRSDTAHVAFLASLNDVDSGILSVRVRPNARRSGWLARDLLAALGKRRDVSGPGRDDHEDRLLVPVWLAAHQVVDVVVTGAESLTASHLADLVDMVSSGEGRLWLLCDGHLGAGVSDLADVWPMCDVPRPDFDTRWSPTAPSEPTDTEPAGSFPGEVPFADFPAFLAEVRRFLPPEDASQIEELYWRGFEAASSRLARVVPSEESMSIFLRSLLGGCPNKAAMVTTLRAAQAAAFNAGWFVQADLGRLLGSGAADIAATVNDPTTWRKLRAYRQPYRAAACALAGANVDVATQRKLRINDVAADGSTVEVGEKAVRVVDEAGVFVAAQRMFRIVCGAGPGDSLMAHPTGNLMTPRLLRQALDDAARELGVVLTSGMSISSKDSVGQWRARLGVSVQSLVPS